MENYEVRTWNNYKEITKNAEVTCICSYCKSRYMGSEIKHWLDRDICDGTAECPVCQVDSVIYENYLNEITEALIDEISKLSFY